MVSASLSELSFVVAGTLMSSREALLMIMNGAVAVSDVVAGPLVSSREALPMIIIVKCLLMSSRVALPMIMILSSAN